jgi:DNA-binding protein HU-beta
MAKLMTKSAIISTLADKSELTKKQVVGLLDEVQALAIKEVKKSGGFVIPGFGKLVLSNRKARMGRNPQTGEPIKIAAKRVVRIRVAKAMKDSVLGGKK